MLTPTCALFVRTKRTELNHVCTGAFAMSTDYDAWREGEESVTVAAVLAVMAKNSENVKKALLAVIPKIAAKDWTHQIKAAHDSRYVMGV